MTLLNQTVSVRFVQTLYLADGQAVKAEKDVIHRTRFTDFRDLMREGRDE